MQTTSAVLPRTHLYHRRSQLLAPPSLYNIASFSLFGNSSRRCLQVSRNIIIAQTRLPVRQRLGLLSPADNQSSGVRRSPIPPRPGNYLRQTTFAKLYTTNTPFAMEANSTSPCDYDYVRKHTSPAYTFNADRLQVRDCDPALTPIVFVACGSCKLRK